MTSYALTVVNGTGGGNYEAGASVSISTDPPQAGKQFKNWTSSNGGTFENANSASTTFTMPANATTVTANNKDIPVTQYTLSVSANNSGWGSVSGGGTFDENTSQTVTATANPGYRFANWTEGGTPVSTSASYTFILSGNRTFVANFEPIPPAYYTLEVNDGTGGGSYTAGTVVNISANTAPSGQAFDKWTGDISGIANVNNASTTCTMGSANATVTTIYKALPPTLSSDATLSGLSLDIPGLTSAFSPSVTAYTATVANSVASVTISATANHTSATVSGTGTKSLNAGSNLFHVVVTAQDGTQKTYTITVTRDTDTAIESVALQTYKHTSAAIHYIYVARRRKR